MFDSVDATTGTSGTGTGAGGAGSRAPAVEAAPVCLGCAGGGAVKVAIEAGTKRRGASSDLATTGGGQAGHMGHTGQYTGQGLADGAAGPRALVGAMAQRGRESRWASSATKTASNVNVAMR